MDNQYIFERVNIYGFDLSIFYGYNVLSILWLSI